MAFVHEQVGEASCGDGSVRHWKRTSFVTFLSSVESKRSARTEEVSSILMCDELEMMGKTLSGGEKPGKLDKGRRCLDRMSSTA